MELSTDPGRSAPQGFDPWMATLEVLPWSADTTFHERLLYSQGVEPFEQMNGARPSLQLSWHSYDRTMVLTDGREYLHTELLRPEVGEALAKAVLEPRSASDALFARWEEILIAASIFYTRTAVTELVGRVEASYNERVRDATEKFDADRLLSLVCSSALDPFYLLPRIPPALYEQIAVQSAGKWEGVTRSDMARLLDHVGRFPESTKRAILGAFSLECKQYALGLSLERIQLKQDGPEALKLFRGMIPFAPDGHLQLAHGRTISVVKILEGRGSPAETIAVVKSLLAQPDPKYFAGVEKRAINIAWVRGVSRILSDFPDLRIPNATRKAILRSDHALLIVAAHASRLKVSHARLEKCLLRFLRKGRFAAALSTIEKVPERILERIESRYGFLQFRREIGIRNAALYRAFRSEKRNGEAAVSAWVDDFKKLDESLFANGKLDKEARTHRFYEVLIRDRFPDTTRFGSFEGSERAPDRSPDLASFTIPDTTRFALRKERLMKLKPDVLANPKLERELERPIGVALKVLSETRYNRELGVGMLHRIIERSAESFPTNCSHLRDFALVALLEWCTAAGSERSAKQAVVGYDLIRREDTQAYVGGTIGEVQRSKMPEYLNLLQLREFYYDRLLDGAFDLIRQGAEAIVCRGLLRDHYTSATTQRESELRVHWTSQLVGAKIGDTRAIRQRMVEASSNEGIPIDRRNAVAKRIEDSERRRIAGVVEKVTGENFDLEGIALEEISVTGIVESILTRRRRPTTEIPTAEVVTFFESRARELFKAEVAAIDQELRKYMPAQKEHGGNREVEFWIAKNTVAAHGIRSAGVCVAGDMPSSNNAKSPCIWNLPNFFPILLRDPKTKRCAGAILCHWYRQGTEKILTVSANPSTTFLLKVDQRQLFARMMTFLENFAQLNGFTKIACSIDDQIRTNRVRTDFDSAMRERIFQINERFELRADHIFSFDPPYKQRDLHILWKNPVRPRRWFRRIFG